MNRGEIWWASLDPTVGSEIRKTRPVVIVSAQDVGVLPIKVVVPITSWNDRFKSAPWMVELHRDVTNGLPKDSFADALQIRSVSVQRLTEKIGTVSSEKLAEIVGAIRIVVGDF